MELWPSLRIGWSNGWLLLAPFYLGYILLLSTFPDAVRRRLYDRSGWTPTQRLLSLVGLPFAGFIIALFNFKDTPFDQPVAQGLYRFSRNPQWVAFALALVGSSLAVGSLSATILFGIRIGFNHFRIIGEEKACLEQYGDAYRAYQEQTPRYFLFI